MTPDLANGLFEVVGGGVLFANVRRLWLDRETRGVSAWPFGFFAAWGAWNLYYYPHLRQWVSLAGAGFALAANVAWLGLYWWVRAGR